MKTHQFMVIHDIRNPSDAIQEGLAQAEKWMTSTLNTMLDETNEMLEKHLTKIINGNS